MVNYTDKEKHLTLIKDVLSYIFSSSASSDLVLKGGTALLLFYGLNRFSEDIDLDATSVNLKNLLATYASKKGYKLRVTKDSEHVKRYMIDYDTGGSLKVEVFYRHRKLRQSDINVVSGVRVYTLERLLKTKIVAFLSANRNKIRDLYDIAHIYFNTDIEITDDLKDRLEDMFHYNNLERIDYIIDNHKDEIIPHGDEEEIRLAMYNILEDLSSDDNPPLNKSNLFT